MVAFRIQPELRATVTYRDRSDQVALLPFNNLTTGAKALACVSLRVTSDLYIVVPRKTTTTSAGENIKATRNSS